MAAEAPVETAGMFTEAIPRGQRLLLEQVRGDTVRAGEGDPILNSPQRGCKLPTSPCNRGHVTGAGLADGVVVLGEPLRRD